MRQKHRKYRVEEKENIKSVYHVHTKDTHVDEKKANLVRECLINSEREWSHGCPVNFFLKTMSRRENSEECKGLAGNTVSVRTQTYKH